MAIKTYKPITPGTRQKTTLPYRELLTKNEPYKPLVKGYKRAVGRNSFGRITMRHKGGGHKRLYRAVDFVFDKKNIPARITSIEYDPNRTAFIGLAVYADGEKRYIVLPQSVKVGDQFIVSENAPIAPGNRLALKNIPVGTFVFNVELKPSGGAKLIRSAGSFAVVQGQTDDYTLLKMSSGEVRNIPNLAYASVGQISNEEHRLVVIGKAGRTRHMGIRPTVRGTAMAAVDHPYGGGEGRQPRGPRRPKTKWGKITGGRKTPKKKKDSPHLIIARRKVGKAGTV